MSLAKRLKGRTRPWTEYPLRIDDTSAAQRDLRAAERAYREALLASKTGEADPAVQELAAARAAAQTVLDACYETVRLTAMASDAFEDLLAEHPPRTGVESDEPLGYNESTFPFALLVECAEGDATAKDWEGFLANASHGEKTELLLVVQALNVRGPSASVPKGWTPTPGS